VRKLKSINRKTNNIETKKGKRRTHDHKKERKWHMGKKRKDEEIRESLWMGECGHTT